MVMESPRPNQPPEKLAAALVVEDAKRRCLSLIDRIHRTTVKPKHSLLRLIHSELSFLHRLSTSHPFPSPLRFPFHPWLPEFNFFFSLLLLFFSFLIGTYLYTINYTCFYQQEQNSNRVCVYILVISLCSLNVGHLEAVMHVLQQPSITGVSRICKSIPLSPSHSIYIDIVCSLNGNPVWFIVSDRNPRYISWEGESSNQNKGLKNKIQQVVAAASQSHVMLRPSSIVLFFSNGIDENIFQKLHKEFGSIDLEMEPFIFEDLESEYEWTNVVLGRSFMEARVIEIKVDKNGRGMNVKNLSKFSRMDRLVSCKKRDECSEVNLGTSFSSLLSGMKCWCCSFDDDLTVEVESLKKLGDAEANLVNFDTTAVIAIISGISNGGTERVLASSECELRGRFKGNFGFVIAQVNSEIHNPIHGELSVVLAGKRGIICESVHSEFQELISICGGPNEKLRAKSFLKLLKVVPDCPSTRLLSLPTTRKLALKNKVVFGTGDYWHALTVTANMAFVRAVSQTGMSLPVIEHRPRALIGD